MPKSKRMQDLEDGVREVQRQGQGVYRFLCYTAPGLAELKQQAEHGDREATRIFIGLMSLAKACRRGKVDCLLCGKPFGQHHAPIIFALLVADSPNAATSIGNAICGACISAAGSHDALQQAVVKYYRANMITDLRVVMPHPTPGHA